MSILTRKKWHVGNKIYTPPPLYDGGGVIVPPTMPQPTALHPPVTQLSSATIQSIAKPGYLESVIDSSFGYPMKITRISDPTVFGVSGSPYVIDNGYSKQQHWNVDGTRLKVGRRNLLNGVTYEYIKSMATTSGATFWSNVDPNLVWVVGGGTIRKHDPRIGASGNNTLWMDFTQLGFLNDSNFSLGNAEGNLDNYDKYVVIHATRASDSAKCYICVDLENQSIVSVASDADLEAPYSCDWVSISQSGNYIVANKNESTGDDGASFPNVKTVFDRNFNKIRDIGTGSHRDFGWSQNGEEIMTGAGYIWMDELKLGGTRTVLMPGSLADPIYGGPGDVGGHTSGVHIDFPGWTLYSFTSDNNTTKEVFAIKNDTSREVMRFCSMRYTRYDYDGEPQASANRDLTKVIFDTDWNANLGNNGSIDVYVCEVP